MLSKKVKHSSCYQASNQHDRADLAHLVAGAFTVAGLHDLNATQIGCAEFAFELLPIEHVEPCRKHSTQKVGEKKIDEDETSAQKS